MTFLRSSLLAPTLCCALLTSLSCKRGHHGPKENVDPKEKAAAAKLVAAKDPIEESMAKYRHDIRQDFLAGRYKEIETKAQEARKSKATFPNGSWKIVQLYDALECDRDEPETEWEKFEGRHEEWLALQPQSITARVAYADFLTNYAWHARGSGYSDTVTELGWRLMDQRLKRSGHMLNDARTLPEMDPCWWSVALRVGLGLNYNREQFDTLVKEAHEYEPTFWGYDTSRAYSLLPRWHGEPGDWEAFAKETSHRDGGLGAETYARIVIYLRPFHTNIFHDSKASWPMTRIGLEEMRKKYPQSIEIVAQSALLATMAKDRTLAKVMYDQLGDTYLPAVFDSPERYVHYRNWAQTGKW